MKVYEIINKQILDKLEEGTVPWHKPWSGGSLPTNIISKKPYRGINVWVLSFTEFSSPYWGTFQQIKSLGGTVIKGSKGMPVMFYKFLQDTRVDDDGDVFTRQVPLMRYFTVFNIEQCEGIDPEKIPGATFKPGVFEVNDICESVVSSMPLCPEIKFKEQWAYYSPKLDYVNMPKKETFDNPGAYYSVLFHELGHSTGHKSRLARKDFDGNGFGTDKYSKEELVAEMTAAYLCNHCTIDNTTIDRSAAYISHWLEVLKNDKMMLIQAASAAQKAAEYILNKKETV